MFSKYIMTPDELYIYSKWITFTMLVGLAVFIAYHFLTL